MINSMTFPFIRGITAFIILSVASAAVAQNLTVSFTDESAAIDFVHASNDNGGNGLSGASMFSDYDNDGDQDFFTVGCTTEIPLNLFRNDGQGHFTDVTSAAGFTTPALYMGLCGADYDHDGDTDVFSTNYSSTRTDLRHALYRNNGDGTFSDVAPGAGVAAHEFAWGCSFTDLDNDGWDDLFFTGALDTVCQPGVSGCPDIDTIGPGRGNPGSLFIASSSGRFQEFTDQMPIDLSREFSSGVAHGDYDGNGFSDLLVIREEVPAHNGRARTSGHPVLLRNQGNGNNWVSFSLEGSQSNRDAVGARVTVHAQDLGQSREVYAGSSHLRILAPPDSAGWLRPWRWMARLPQGHYSPARAVHLTRYQTISKRVTWSVNSRSALMPATMPRSNTKSIMSPVAALISSRWISFSVRMYLAAFRLAPGFDHDQTHSEKSV